jgi:hypothetical protein
MSTDPLAWMDHQQYRSNTLQSSLLTTIDLFPLMEHNFRYDVGKYPVKTPVSFLQVATVSLSHLKRSASNDPSSCGGVFF